MDLAADRSLNKSLQRWAIPSEGAIDDIISGVGLVCSARGVFRFVPSSYFEVGALAVETLPSCIETTSSFPGIMVWQ